MFASIKKFFFENWKKQSIIVIIITCLVINGLGVVLYFKNERINVSKSWVLHSYEVLRKTRNLLTDLQDLELRQREYILIRQTSYAQTLSENITSINKKLDDLVDFVSDNPSQINRATKIRNVAHNQEDSIKNQIRLFTNIKNNFTLGDIELSSARLTNTRIAIDEFIEAEKKLLDSREADQNRRVDNFVETLLFGSIFSVLALLAASALVVYYSARGTKAEDALKKSEEIYSIVTQGINEGIFEFNVPEKTIFFSPSFKKMLGYEDHEFESTTENLNEHIHPDDLESTREVSRKYFNKETGEYRNYFRMKHKDGYYLWIMSRGVGVWDEDGRIQRLIGTHTDISEQKETEEYLKRLNSEIENFTYITSHDLRSPLVNLKGFASELQFSVDDLYGLITDIKTQLDDTKRKMVQTIFEKDIPEALGYIKTSIERLDQLTSAILDLSKIGRRELKLEMINTRQVVQKCLDSLAYEINEKDISVTLGTLPEITGDLGSVQQIFSNIIENAIKYLNPNRPGMININGKLIPGEALFTIEDNGRGISETDKAKVFDMFKRARNVENVRGVGMGMSYVKATVQRLGGNIWFESQLDEGSKFMFTIPTKIRREI